MKNKDKIFANIIITRFDYNIYKNKSKIILKANIDGARATGMDGHCYYHGDIEILKKDMVEKGIRI